MSILIDMLGEWVLKTHAIILPAQAGVSQIHALLGSPQRSFNLELPQKVKDKLAEKAQNGNLVNQEDTKAEESHDQMI